MIAPDWPQFGLVEEHMRKIAKSVGNLVAESIVKIAWVLGVGRWDPSMEIVLTGRTEADGIELEWTGRSPHS